MYTRYHNNTRKYPYYIHFVNRKLSVVTYKRNTSSLILQTSRQKVYRVYGRPRGDTRLRIPFIWVRGSRERYDRGVTVQWRPRLEVGLRGARGTKRRSSTGTRLLPSYFKKKKGSVLLVIRVSRTLLFSHKLNKFLLVPSGFWSLLTSFPRRQTLRQSRHRSGVSDTVSEVQSRTSPSVQKPLKTSSFTLLYRIRMFLDETVDLPFTWLLRFLRCSFGQVSDNFTRSTLYYHQTYSLHSHLHQSLRDPSSFYWVNN